MPDSTKDIYVPALFISASNRSGVTLGNPLVECRLAHTGFEAIPITLEPTRRYLSLTWVETRNPRWTGTTNRISPGSDTEKPQIGHIFPFDDQNRLKDVGNTVKMDLRLRGIVG
jgi:hypothetical protein